MEIYLDNSATTKAYPEVAELVADIMLHDYGNASSMHQKGVDAEKYLKYSKSVIAGIMKVKEKEIFFTSGGTESDNWALMGAAFANQRSGKHLITTQIEHPAVLRTMDHLKELGFEVTYLSVDEYGHISLEELKRAVRPDTILVSIMFVNNEVGAIQPIDEAGEIIKSVNPRTLFHVDAVQGFGKLRLLPKKWKIDMVSVSGHKIHAPKGVGALYVKKGLILPNLIHGGGQENGLFSGTENMPAIAGFGAAAAALPDPMTMQRDMKRLRRRLITKLSKVPTILFNSPDNGLASIVNISILGMPSQVLVNCFSERGICVSAGSACKSGHRREVLTQLGFSPIRIDSAIRVSMSRFTTEEEIDRFVEVAIEASNELRQKVF